MVVNKYKSQCFHKYFAKSVFIYKFCLGARLVTSSNKGQLTIDYNWTGLFENKKKIHNVID